MKISGTKAYVTIETDEYTCVFGGELCDGFAANPLDVRWDRLPDDGSEVTIIKVIRDVWEECRGKKHPVTFDFFNVKDLLEVFNMIPGRIGTITDVNDDSFIWRLPNGIIVRVFVTRIPDKRYPTSIAITEWYVGYSYDKDGKEIALTHSHLDTHEVFEELVDIQDGNTFWVIKINVFGKKSAPLIMEKAEFDKIKNKDKYRILK